MATYCCFAPHIRKIHPTFECELGSDFTPSPQQPAFSSLHFCRLCACYTVVQNCSNNCCLSRRQDMSVLSGTPTLPKVED